MIHFSSRDFSACWLRPFFAVVTNDAVDLFLLLVFPSNLKSMIGHKLRCFADLKFVISVLLIVLCVFLLCLAQVPMKTKKGD